MTPPIDSPPSRRRRFRVDALFTLALAAFVALSAYRAWLTERSLAAYLDCSGCLVRPVLAQDLWLLAALVSLFQLARGVGSRRLAALPAVVGAALTLAFVVDIGVQRLLARRLLLADVANYGDEFAANWSVLRPLLAQPEGWALFAAAVLLVFGATAAIAAAAAAPRAQGRLAWSVVLGTALALALWSGPTWYLNRGAYENVVAINRGSGMARQYGPATIQRLQATPAPAPVCEPGLRRRSDVIVLVVESWSMHHSRLFSGLQDLTPAMDALARRGNWYPDFRTNGFSTEGGLAALLTGTTPLSGIRHGTIMLFTEVTGDFHRRLRADGVGVHFFTSGELAFTHRERWLELIGIDDAEGASHPAYAGRARGAFGAASDEALLQRVLDWYDRERGDRPFVATVLTVGMHPPFVPLDGADPGERGAVRATDAAVARFAEGLERRGFFADGLLFVVGDHRIMTPLGREELSRFGPDAMVRVPAFALGATGTPPGPVRGDFQQVDLVPSLQYLLGANGCRSFLQGRLFGAEPTPAAAQLYADPMHYDQVRARVAGHEHLLVLDGDDSRWLGAVPDPGYDLALEVARLRVTRDKPPPR